MHQLLIQVIQNSSPFHGGPKNFTPETSRSSNEISETSQVLGSKTRRTSALFLVFPLLALGFPEHSMHKAAPRPGWNAHRGNLRGYPIPPTQDPKPTNRSSFMVENFTPLKIKPYFFWGGWHCVGVYTFRLLWLVPAWCVLVGKKTEMKRNFNFTLQSDTRNNQPIG